MPEAAVRARTLIKRTLNTLLGAGATQYAHALYHAILRRTGQFGLNDGTATQDLLGALAERAGTLIDVGVNMGRYSWFMANRRRAGVPLYGFEPNAEAYALAQRNLRALPDIILLPLGLGETDRDAILAVPRDAAGTPVSGLGFILEDGPAPAASDAQTVALRRLDGLIGQGHVRIGPPVLLKIDIEGYEPAALAGMTDLLTRHRPWIFFECEPDHLRRAGYDWPAVFTPLQQHGYLILTETSAGFARVCEPAPGCVNYFALVPETMPQLPAAPFLNL